MESSSCQGLSPRLQSGFSGLLDRQGGMDNKKINNVIDFCYSFVSAPLIQGQFAIAPKFQRFKRYVLEGTLEELIDNIQEEI